MQVWSLLYTARSGAPACSITFKNERCDITATACADSRTGRLHLLRGWIKTRISPVDMRADTLSRGDASCFSDELLAKRSGEPGESQRRGKVLLGSLVAHQDHLSAPRVPQTKDSAHFYLQ